MSALQKSKARFPTATEYGAVILVVPAAAYKRAEQRIILVRIGYSLHSIRNFNKSVACIHRVVSFVNGKTAVLTDRKYKIVGNAVLSAFGILHYSHIIIHLGMNFVGLHRICTVNGTRAFNVVYPHRAVSGSIENHIQLIVAIIP